jgi:hypothetical protein
MDRISVRYPGAALPTGRDDEKQKTGAPTFMKHNAIQEIFNMEAMSIITVLPVPAVNSRMFAESNTEKTTPLYTVGTNP